MIPVFDERNAWRLTGELVAFGPRSSGSDANLKQAEFIAKTAESYGALISRQEFRRTTPAGPIRFVNVEAVIPGKRSDFIIVGSHFDTKKLPPGIKFEGANDGASSTAVLLELIRAVKHSGVKPEYTLKFVFFDGEECFNEYTDNDGLFGSRYYARQLSLRNEVRQCRAVIILDMVGDRDLNITLPLNSDKQLCGLLFEAAAEAGHRKYFDYFSGELLDDHIPFKKLGIPVMDIIDFEFGPGNSFWHTSEDRLSNMSAESLKIVGQTVLRLVFFEKIWKKM
ncbi:MAG: M28 family metallopeptidase [Victivallaceae bacterium]|nr:M28 family metallopeptidase [Victivallaceae bacterium]